MLAEFRESTVEGGLASTKADTKSAVGIKLNEPTRDRVVAKLVTRLRCEAMGAREVAPIG
jgi:hypothetical protein